MPRKNTIKHSQFSFYITKEMREIIEKLVENTQLKSISQFCRLAVKDFLKRQYGILVEDNIKAKKYQPGAKEKISDQIIEDTVTRELNELAGID